MTGPRVASLGMYDAPALHAANDALWDAIAARLAASGIAGVPTRLDRTGPPAALWADPRLLLAQTCGYPLVTAFAGRLRYVATPCYRAPGCAGAHYRSRIIVRADDPAQRLDDLRGRRAAINDRASNSGMNLLRATLAPLATAGRFLAATIETGSHAASVRAVVAGCVDCAAIDAISFAHLERDEPALVAGVRTIAWSGAAPGLPLVTSMETSDDDLARLRAALDDCATLPMLAEARDTLLLDGFARLPEGAYDAILDVERSAVRAGYPQLG